MSTESSWLGTEIRKHRIFSLLVVSLMTNVLHADEIQMQNGDRYFGKITTLNTNSLILQSDVLGNVQLPRSKVASIILDTNVVANVGSTALSNIPPVIAKTNVAPDASASLRQLAAHTDLINQVQSRYLADAGPEANAKFAEMMSGLSTGNLNINDLRAEAKKTADQVRELKRGLGENETSSLDFYLSVLDKFLKESPAPAASSTPSPALKSPLDSDE